MKLRKVVDFFGNQVRGENGTLMFINENYETVYLSEGYKNEHFILDTPIEYEILQLIIKNRL